MVHLCHIHHRRRPHRSKRPRILEPQLHLPARLHGARHAHPQRPTRHRSRASRRNTRNPSSRSTLQPWPPHRRLHRHPPRATPRKQGAKMNLWLLFIILGIGNFLLRFSFVYLFGKVKLSQGLRRALRFVPPTVLLSLIMPAVLRHQGSLDLSLNNPKFYAGIVAGLIAYKTRSVLLTLIVGMGLLYLLQTFI